MSLQKFIIERDIPKVGAFERDQLRGAAAKSNEVLRRLGPDIQWVESYVADNKTFCVYLAKDEAIIREHAAISGFPATKITAVKKMIDPTTEAACRPKQCQEPPTFAFAHLTCADRVNCPGNSA